MLRYRVCAYSATRPGTFLLLDEEDNWSVYFTSTGSLSVTTLDPALTDAIVRGDGWCRIDVASWLSLEELRDHIVGTVFMRQQELTQPEA